MSKAKLLNPPTPTTMIELRAELERKRTRLRERLEEIDTKIEAMDTTEGLLSAPDRCDDCGKSSSECECLFDTGDL